MNDLFRGELVRFTFEEPDVKAKAEARWQCDSEFVRLAGNEPAPLSSEKKVKERVEKWRAQFAEARSAGAQSKTGAKAPSPSP